MEKEEVKMPLIMAIDEAEKSIVKCVNDVITTYKLPCYLLESIVDKIHKQLKEGAKTELTEAKNDYARQMATNAEE